MTKSSPTKTMWRHKLLLLSIALSATHFSVTARSAALEEVVVTAQKREQNLQDVPISVVAVTGDEINAKGYGELGDITAALPNVTVNESALGDVLFIRGIGSGVNIGFEQSVATFIDGVYFGRGLQSRNAFLDVERVEVLRGPQVAFFGNSAIAGALNITTRNPGEEFKGGFTLAYEDGTDKLTSELTAGGPLSDTLGARIALRYLDQDGWQTNSTIDEDEPQEKRYAGRVTFDWNPTDTLQANLKLQAEKTDTVGRALQAVGCPPPSGQNPALPAPTSYCLSYGALPEADFKFDDNRLGPGPGGPFPTDADFNDLESKSAIATLNWDLDEYTLTSVTSYSEYEDHRSQAGASIAGPFPNPSPFPGPFGLLYNFEHVQEDFEQFSQELRITSPSGDSFEWMAGAYYQDIELDVTNDFAAGPTGTRLSNHFQEDQSWSVFGTATWHVSPTLRTTLSLRYTEVDKDVVRTQVIAQNAGNLDLDLAEPIDAANPLNGFLRFAFGWQDGTLAASRSDNDTNPSINIQYDLNNSTMIYASFAQGFKAGGFDEQNGTLDPVAMTFEPEEVDSYEIGFKSRLLDGSMQLNAAVFRNEYENLQVSTFDGVINFLVSNAASSVAQGLEVDFLWQVSDTLRLSFQGAYLDAYYEERLNGQCTSAQAAGIIPGCDFSGTAPAQDLSDETLPWAPEYAGNITLEHSFDIKGGYELVTTAQLVYEDEFETVDDNDPFLRQDAYTKANLAVRLSSPENRWDVSLIGKNIFDKRTSHQGNDLPLSAGSYFKMLDKPRTVAVQGRFRF